MAMEKLLEVMFSMLHGKVIYREHRWSKGMRQAPAGKDMSRHYQDITNEDIAN
jgi:hypothetical protein